MKVNDVVISVHWAMVGTIKSDKDEWGFVMVEWHCLTGHAFPVRPEYLKRKDD